MLLCCIVLILYLSFLMLCLFDADVMIMLGLLHILIDEIYDSDYMPLIQMVLWQRIVGTQEEVEKHS